MARPAPEIRVVPITADVVLNAAVETIIAQIDGISTENADEDVAIFAFIQLTTAALTTALTPRIRRGSTVAGALVGEATNVAAAASAAAQVFAFGRDNPGAVAGQIYVVTLQAVGPAANGTIHGSLSVAIVGAQG